MKLSVIIITKNEAAHIEQCIASVFFADEIIVLDSGSSDETCALAKRAGAKVFQSADWPGFGPQKNRALSYAQGQWILSLDADERVSPQLAEEIQQVIASDCTVQPALFEAYEISRLSCYAGRWMYHSGWHPDFILRLFRRDKARFSDDLVHESVQYKGSLGQLQGVIYHYPYDSQAAHIAKMSQYAEAAAQGLYARGKKIGMAGIAVKMLWTFIRIYFIRKGFLDGRQGFILALMAATGNMFRYTQLWFLNQGVDWHPERPDEANTQAKPPTPSRLG